MLGEELNSSQRPAAMLLGEGQGEAGAYVNGSIQKEKAIRSIQGQHVFMTQLCYVDTALLSSAPHFSPGLMKGKS